MPNRWSPVVALLFAAGAIAHDAGAQDVSAPASDPRLEIARHLVVMLSPPRSDESPQLQRARFLERMAPLALVPLDDLVERATVPDRDPFGLDPARVLRLAAADPAAARTALATLAGDPQVEWAEPEFVREACAFPLDDSPPDDPLYRDTRQWGLWNAGAAGVFGGLSGADIGAREAWRLSCGANQVLLGVADTGIDPSHPDLIRALPDGAPRLAIAANLTLEPQGSWADSNGHGTAVAGVMAALTHDGAHFDSLGIAGVCGGDGRDNAGCRLAIFKIAPGHSGSASSFDIARAIVMAADAGVRALNLSFAGDGASIVERRALYYAITRGCVVVAAIGNRGVTAPLAPQYPAAYAADGLCVGVGASDAWDRRAAFSSHGPGLDLLAPGLDIWTTGLTYPNGFGASTRGYLDASGTSLAAPFVTGTIGLMAARCPRLGDVDFQQLLRASARDLGPPGPDPETGWGRLDAVAALRRLPDGTAVWHDETTTIAQASGVFDRLRVAADSFGTFDRGAWWSGRLAERVEVSATITLPDSFADSASVCPRIGGTMALRGDFHLDHYAPWAEVAARNGRQVTLRGWLYHVLDAPDSLDAWLPLPPDEARIGFTVLGALRAPATLGVAPRAGDRTRLAATPNPARGAVRLLGAPGTRFQLLDLAGRSVRAGAIGPGGAFQWDRRDESGLRVRAGLYFLRAPDQPGLRVTRLVILE